MKIDKKQSLEEALRALQAQHPDLDIQAGLDHAEDNAAKKEITEAGEARRLIPIVRTFAEAYPRENGKQIAARVKKTTSPEVAVKLGDNFARDVSRFVNAHRNRKLRLPKTVAAQNFRISAASETSFAATAGTGQAGAINVAISDARPVDPAAANIVLKPAGARESRATVSAKSNDAEAANLAVVQPNLLALDNHPASKAQLVRFAGSFAGSVYKSGHPAVGDFFDIVKKSASEDDLRQAALRIDRDEAARAAMATINAKDRAFYEQALATA